MRSKQRVHLGIGQCEKHVTITFNSAQLIPWPHQSGQAQAASGRGLGTSCRSVVLNHFTKLGDFLAWFDAHARHKNDATKSMKTN